ESYARRGRAAARHAGSTSDRERYGRAVNPTDRADLRARVEKALAVFLAQQRALLVQIDPALAPVADAIAAFVLGGGKRLRPAFAYWGYRGAGGHDSDEIVT